MSQPESLWSRFNFPAGQHHSTSSFLLDIHLAENEWFVIFDHWKCMEIRLSESRRHNESWFGCLAQVSKLRSIAEWRIKRFTSFCVDETKSTSSRSIWGLEKEWFDSQSWSGFCYGFDLRLPFIKPDHANHTDPLPSNDFRNALSAESSVPVERNPVNN